MDQFTGTWGTDTVTGPELRGELILEKDGPAWRGRIGAFQSEAEDRGGRISLIFPGGSGEFRGRLSNDSAEVRGHWIQPPGLANQFSYATPLTLKAGESLSAWHGEVAPLSDRIHMYLVIEAEADGRSRAFIRDPESNSGVFLQLQGAAAKDGVLRLTPRDPGQAEIQGVSDEKAGTMTIALPFYPSPLLLTRRGRDNAPGFYPRTPHIEAYTYTPPAPGSDGWETGSLEEAHIDPAPIKALVESILRSETTGLAAPYIHGLLIARGGKLVLEEYFYGFDRDLPHDMRSASKSLASVLLGIAMDKEARLSGSSPVYSCFPQYASFDNDDPRKHEITVEHLVTMTSGYACDDEDDSSPGNEDTMQSQEAQPDWYKYTLDLPMVRKPGEQAVYCSAGMNLLGGVISNATGEWLPEFFRDNLALPLDFGRYHLQLMPRPDDNLYLGGGSYFRPRDFMKIGQLFLDSGRWRGRQVVSLEWLEESIKPHSGLNNEGDYGYGWHLTEYQVGGKRYSAVYASGNGGQLLIVVPNLELVIMFTAGNYGDYRTWKNFRDVLVPEYILPAALRV